MVPYRSVLIVGGGTAGWLAALHFQHLLGRNPEIPVQITLLESADIGTIGVGEATVPTLKTTLQQLGISEIQLFTEADATLKNGIRFVGWREGGSAQVDGYDHPFETPPTFEGHSTILHWLNARQHGLTRQSFGDAGGVQTALMELGLSPKLFQSAEYDAPFNYAYHLDAQKLAILLRRVATERGVTHIIGEVRQTSLGEMGISAVHLADGQTLEADLYVDCTGFSSVLLGKALGVPWESYAETLLCDRAVACPIDYASPQAPVRSFTTSTAQESGWTWEIDLQSRRGTGYVYSSAHCSDDEALSILRRQQAGGRPLAEPRWLPMRTGHRARMWEKNCLALGLSSGFIEPLESTGIYLVEFAMQLFGDFLPTDAGMDRARARYNRLMNEHYDHLHDFILLHYVLSGRRDTAFWRDCTAGARIPLRLQAKLDQWHEMLPHVTDVPRKLALFGENSFFYILSGLGYLPERGSALASYIDPKSSKRALLQITRLRDGVQDRFPPLRDYVSRIRASGVMRHFAL